MGLIDIAMCRFELFAAAAAVTVVTVRRAELYLEFDWVKCASAIGHARQVWNIYCVFS